MFYYAEAVSMAEGGPSSLVEVTTLKIKYEGPLSGLNPTAVRPQWLILSWMSKVWLFYRDAVIHSERAYEFITKEDAGSIWNVQEG